MTEDSTRMERREAARFLLLRVVGEEEAQRLLSGEKPPNEEDLELVLCTMAWRVLAEHARRPTPASVDLIERFALGMLQQADLGRPSVIIAEGDDVTLTFDGQGRPSVTVKKGTVTSVLPPQVDTNE